MMHSLDRYIVVLAAFFFSSYLASAGELQSKDEAPKIAWRQLKPDRLMSDESVFYISTPDVRKARAAFEHSALRGLLNEEEVLKPFMSAVGKIRDTYVKGDGTLDESEVRRRTEEINLLLRIIPYLDGQLAFAVEPSGAKPGRTGRFLLIASMPAGDAGEERQKLIEDVLIKYRDNLTTNSNYKVVEDHIGSYDVHGLENASINLKEEWAFVENLFVYGQGNRVVMDAVDRYSVKTGTGTLALHNGYQSCYRVVGRDDRGDALLYLQFDFRSFLQPFVDGTQEFRQLKDLLTTNANKIDLTAPQIAVGMQIGEGDNAVVNEKIFVRASKENLPRVDEPCKAITARFAPNDAFFFRSTQSNLADSYAKFIESFNVSYQIGSGGKEALIDQQLKNVLGISSDAEMLKEMGLFKGEMSTFISYVPQPNLKYESWVDLLEMFQIVFAVELDRDNTVGDVSLRNLLGKFEIASTGQPYAQTTYEGETLHYQKGAAPREEKPNTERLGLIANLFSRTEDSKRFPFFASYTRVNLDIEGSTHPRKFLLLSDSLYALKKAVRQYRAPHSALSEVRKFKYFSQLFQESRYEFSYLDLPKFINVYAGMVPILTGKGGMSRDILNKLPNPNAMRDHLFPMAWSSTAGVDPVGIMVECSSPTGNLPLLGLGASMAWPAITALRQKAISDQVDDRFKRISLSLQLHAADWDNFPQQLSELLPNYCKDRNLFESPFKKGAVKMDSDVDNPELSNLVYVPNHSLQDLSRDILLYENEPSFLAKGTDGSKLLHHVLTVDGKLTSLPKASLDRRLGGKIDIANKSAASANEKDKQPVK